MHEYYHPAGNPLWANDDWLRSETPWDPDTTPLDTLAANGFYQVTEEAPDPSLYCPYIYLYTWSERIESPYCVKFVSNIQPLSLDDAKQSMLNVYPAYESDIEQATSIAELQDIYNSIQ